MATNQGQLAAGGDDERQPLLVSVDTESQQAQNSKPPSYNTESQGELAAEEAEELARVAPKKKSKGIIALYVVLWILAIALIALFIKGWIDSDDVDVSIPSSTSK